MFEATKTLASVCTDTDLKFGTSGVRGRVTALSPTICHAFTTVLLTQLYPKQAVTVTKTNTLDGLRLTLSNQDILHLRASGNANELRFYTESDNKELAITLCNQGIDWANQILRSCL